MSKAVLKEIEKRLKAAEEAAAPRKFQLVEFCFPAQYAFITDSTRFKTAVCSRRAGKTIGIVGDMIATCEAEPNVICLYVTLTFKNARSILWPDLKRLIKEYEIKCKTDDQRLEIKFPNGSEIRLGGAKDEAEIEKYRGLKLRKVYLDEMQSFRAYVKYFINDILLPALRDLRGSLIITGTPGPVPAGPFYEYATSPNLAHHTWTAFDNPHMHLPPTKDLNITLAEERMMKGISENDPGYQRETYGKWVDDPNALVYKFNKDRNVTRSIPADLTYIFGIDIGYNDADAIAVVGFDYKHDCVYLVEEFIAGKQTITDLVNKIQELDAKYKPVKMLMDAGALGKKIQEEIKQRHAIPVEAAEKSRKFEFIELLNDDLRTGRFKAKPETRFEEDCFLTVWDRSELPKLVVSDTYHTDIGDAVLYAWREAKHYIPKSTTTKTDVNSAAFMDELEEREALAMENKMLGHIDDWGTDQADLDSVYDSSDWDNGSF
jgi:PBSX family phage terminase large subunit